MVNDDDSQVLRPVLELLGPYLAPASRFYICAAPSPVGLTFRNVIEEIGWKFHQSLVWVKDVMVLGHSDYHYQHEDVLYGWTPGTGRPGRGAHKGTKWLGDHAQTTVFHIDRPRRSAEHPTIKPVELVVRCLLNSLRPGGVLVDPFVGSGTTIIAAEQTGRICYAVEIDPGYCDVTRQRYANFVGDSAYSPIGKLDKPPADGVK
jgi:DNA modification methylase